MNKNEWTMSVKLHRDIMDIMSEDLSSLNIESKLAVVSHVLVLCLSAITKTFDIDHEEAASYFDALKKDALNLRLDKSFDQLEAI